MVKVLESAVETSCDVFIRGYAIKALSNLEQSE